jgi:hypothetical protein
MTTYHLWHIIIACHTTLCHVSLHLSHMYFLNRHWRQGPKPKWFAHLGIILKQKKIQWRKPKTRKLTGMNRLFKPNIYNITKCWSDVSNFTYKASKQIPHIPSLNSDWIQVVLFVSGLNSELSVLLSLNYQYRKKN